VYSESLLYSELGRQRQGGGFDWVKCGVCTENGSDVEFFRILKI
jgi:hypothetical protein